MTVHDLPQAEQLPMLRAGARDAIVGGRLYDAHIAEVVRSTGAGVVVTDNRRHFFPRCRLHVAPSAEFLATVKKKPR